MQQHYREEHRWVMPSDVLDRCAPPTPRYGANATVQMLAEQKAAWCAAHGVSVAEYDEHDGDIEWLKAVMDGGGRAV